ncbi:MAG: LD-carboxypeptidase [Candidatus Latescibacterota bacterium]|nr:LD-carboxypeptidase [Candidatus Latescibacterota bacterium]
MISDPLLAPALRSGDTIALVAPSHPGDQQRIEAASQFLRHREYGVEVMAHSSGSYHYLAGRDSERASDLMRAFENPAIAALFCVRGGYGSGRTLDLLDYDVIARHPKAVVGFSDSTALHLGLYARTGLVGFTGCLTDLDLATDPPNPAKHFLHDALWPLLTIARPLGELPISEELGVLRHGVAEGPLVPANLAVLCSLMGTPFAPNLEGCILLVEDVSEYPYRIDRMLTQLRLAGVFSRISGLALGDFTACFEPEEMELSPTLEEIVEDAVGNRDLPILTGVPYGHLPRRLVLPIGGAARMTTDPASLSMTAPTVR